jgi:hypothetical protein
MLLRKPSAIKIATTQLEDARRCLLEHQSAAEYHSHMSAYYAQAIARLEAFVKPQETSDEQR